MLIAIVGALVSKRFKLTTKPPVSTKSRNEKCEASSVNTIQFKMGSEVACVTNDPTLDLKNKVTEVRSTQNELFEVNI